MSEALQTVLDSDPEALEIFSGLTSVKQRNIIFFIHRYKNQKAQLIKHF